MKPICIAGAGISGLFAAYSLVKKGYSDIHIYEKNKVGGLISTSYETWGVVESAANGYLNSRNFEDLVQDLQIDIIRPLNINKKRFIYRKRPRQWPLSPWHLFKVPFQFFKLKPPLKNLSLYDYLIKYFDEETITYLIEPALLGVFALPVKELSAQMIYDYFFTFKSISGSFGRGTRAPRLGMGELIFKLKDWLQEHGVVFHIKDFVWQNDKTNIIATNALDASLLLQTISPALSKILSQIEYKPLTTTTLAFDRPGPVRGFGCLFPSDQGYSSYGVLFNTDIFSDRGSLPTETWISSGVEESEALLIHRLQNESARLQGQERKLLHYKLTRWPQALPCYNLRLEQLLLSLNQELVNHKEVHLIGNYLGRIGVTKLLDLSIDLAEKISAST